MASFKVANLQAAQQYMQLTLEGDAQAVPETGAAQEKRDNPEERTQIALFAKRRVLVSKYPELRYLHATLNGIYIPPALLKQVADAGLTKGVLDIRLDVPHVDPETGETWWGLSIDLKDYDGRPTPEQLDWAKQLWTCRIRAYFCGGDKRRELTPLQDAWYTIAAFLLIVGADNWQAELTRAQELQLADMIAAENLSKQQKKAERDANRLARALSGGTDAPSSLKPQAAPSVKKKAAAKTK